MITLRLSIWKLIQISVFIIRFQIIIKKIFCNFSRRAAPSNKTNISTIFTMKLIGFIYWHKNEPSRWYMLSIQRTREQRLNKWTDRSSKAEVIAEDTNGWYTTLERKSDRPRQKETIFFIHSIYKKKNYFANIKYVKCWHIGHGNVAHPICY